MAADLPGEQQLATRDAVKPFNWTPAQKTRSKRKAAFLRALHDEGSITKACKASGVPLSTVHRWRGAYPAFAKAVDTYITTVREQVLEDNLFRIAGSTDPKTATAAVKANELLLKAYNRPRWGDHLRTETTVTINQQVQVIHEVRDRMRAQQSEALARLQTRTIDMPLSEPDTRPALEES